MRMIQGSLVALCLIVTAMAKPAENEDAALRAVSQGAEQFSASLFDEILKEHPGNLITSPLSAGIVLAMAAYGAAGETEKQLKGGLHLPADDELGTRGYHNLIKQLNEVTDVDLRVANKIFTAEKFSVKPTFKQVTESSFQSASQSVDFNKSEEAATVINTWVKDNTNNRISSIVNSGDLDSNTAMVLVNAVYFKGQWLDKFDSNLTENMPFHVNSTTVKNVPTMNRQGNYRYGILPGLKASFVELPYKGNQFSMLIILPDEVEGLAEVESKLKTMTVNDILSQGFTREVRLSLPKFKIESKIPLEEPLKKLGMTAMFTDAADFSRIADSPLVVSKVLQKAFIEVNEEGSEAAAVTGLGIILKTIVLQARFRVDRPFFYTIAKVTEQRGRNFEAFPLFSGHVVDPML